jgi:hypothetical protein
MGVADHRGACSANAADRAALSIRLEPDQVAHWQRWIVVEKLKLSRRIKVQAARHHWAVMHLRAGGRSKWYGAN